jgi:hypothetical protein
MTGGDASTTSSETAVEVAAREARTSKLAMTDNVSTTSYESMAATTESPEEATVVHKEIDGVRVVSRGVNRVVVVVVALGVAVVVAVGVAAVVAIGVRIGGGGITRGHVGVVGDVLLRTRIGSPHVDGRHVTNDCLAHSRFSEPEKIVRGHLRRKLDAVRLCVGEDRLVGESAVGHSDEVLENRRRFARRAAGVR